MKNREIADIFEEIADLLEMQDEEWKPRAYRKAAGTIESLSEPVKDVRDRGELQELDGVGESLAEKIEEYIDTGSLEYHEELKEEAPVDIEALTAVESVGPKTVRKLYQELDVRDLEDLEEAAENDKIKQLEGFGEKTQETILEHIDRAKKSQERMLLGKIFPTVVEIEDRIRELSFDKVEIVGSFRRRRPTIGDIDVLATAERPEEAMDELSEMEEVKEVLGKGETKTSVIISGDVRLDLRIVDQSSWGSALMYFTGSKYHNIEMRDVALEQDLKLNEYGLFNRKTGEKVAGKTEEEVFNELGMEHIPPEMRENTGEIQAARDESLPEPVEREDIRGDLQMHTVHSDGKATVRQMAEKAEELGYEYILITDHGPSLHVADGPENVEELREQREEIEDANESFDVDVLHGMEANITEEGVDVDSEMLDMLDLVVVAMHNRIEDPTEKILRAFENYPVDIFAHPLNRKVNQREPLDLEMDRIVEKAVEEDVALEINSQPRRLDIPWNVVKEHRDAKYVVSTDAHSPREMDYMHLGVSQARRGWLEKENVLNTHKLEEMMEYFRE